MRYALVFAAIMASAAPSFAGQVRKPAAAAPPAFATQKPVNLNGVNDCSLQLTFPQCSEGHGNLD